MLVHKIIGATTADQTEVHKAYFRLGRLCERIGVRVSFRTVPFNGKFYTMILPKTPEDSVAIRIASTDRLIPASQFLSTE